MTDFISIVFIKFRLFFWTMLILSIHLCYLGTCYCCHFVLRYLMLTLLIPSSNNIIHILLVDVQHRPQTIANEFFVCCFRAMLVYFIFRKYHLMCERTRAFQYNNFIPSIFASSIDFRIIMLKSIGDGIPFHPA